MLDAALLFGLMVGSQPAVPVRLANAPFADLRTVTAAKALATQMFADAGFRLDWRLDRCRDCIEVVLDSEAPSRFAYNALGYATVGKRAVSVHVFYNRVAAIHSRELTTVVLAHVMAHEIVHALENAPRHSQEGVMKPHWDAADYGQMARQALPIDGADQELLRKRFAKR